MDKQLVNLVKSVASTNNHWNNININIYSIINNIRVISEIITSIQATNIQPFCLKGLLLLLRSENRDPASASAPLLATKNIWDFKGHCLKLWKFCFASLTKLSGKLLGRVTCVFTLSHWNGEPIPKKA